MKKLSMVLEGIKAVASFGAGLLVAHECDKHDVPTTITATASCSTVAVTYKVLSVVEKYAIEADEKKNKCDEDVDEYVFENIPPVEKPETTNVTEFTVVKEEAKEETTEESKIENVVESEAASTEEVKEEKETAVEEAKETHQTKNVNDDMILAKQSLSAAEKKELEKEIGKQPSRPSRK